jgi:hypothetical protein
MDHSDDGIHPNLPRRRTNLYAWKLLLLDPNPHLLEKLNPDCMSPTPTSDRLKKVTDFQVNNDDLYSK